MNKNILKKMEKIEEKRKLPDEVKKKIKDRAISNWAICISAIILVLTFKISANFLPKQATALIYNVCAIEILIFSLIVLEIAYKKDNGKWAICGIEILVLAVFTLFSPYIFYRANNSVIYVFIAIMTIYYIAKIIRIYFLEKKQYLLGISDITNIIKKESQDEVAKKEQEKILKRIGKKSTNKDETAKKTTTKTKSKSKTNAVKKPKVKVNTKTSTKSTAKAKTKTTTKAKPKTQTKSKTTKKTNKENK